MSLLATYGIDEVPHVECTRPLSFSLLRHSLGGGAYMAAVSVVEGHVSYSSRCEASAYAKRRLIGMGRVGS